MKPKIRITIEAPQGWGKTRLALALAHWVCWATNSAVEIFEEGQKSQVVGSLGQAVETRIVTKQTRAR